MKNIKVKATAEREYGDTAIDSFADNRNGKGTKEWSDRSYNICDGCEHGCLYCFAKAMRARFDATVREPGNWERQRLKPTTPLGKGCCTNQVVMYPTAHDITPQFVGESLATVQNLLADGNKVLIVTKPHLSVVEVLCRELKGRKQNILFRFTIGSLDPDLCAFWEPHAPSPLERIAALRHASAIGFGTSVSIEPMLGSVDETIRLVGQIESLVTDTIWIGKMQRIPRKHNAHIPGFEAARDLVRAQQSDEEILRLVGLLNQNPKVRWKDSIKAVITKSNRPEAEKKART
jgi:DNA repair photolyase